MRSRGWKRTWVLTGTVLLLASMFAGCVSRGDYDRLQKLVENQDRVIRNLKEYNQDLQMKYDRAASNDPILQEQLDKALKELEIYKEQTAKLEKKWQDRVAQIQDLPPGFETVKGGIRAEGTALFDSGEHSLKTSGKAALKQIATSLQGLLVRVEGHTDNDPVKVTKNRYPYGNLELSGRRALEVANFLIRECNFPARSVSYCGYGQYKPIATNDTKAGKARNRRVEIRVFEGSEEEVPHP